MRWRARLPTARLIPPPAPGDISGEAWLDRLVEARDAGQRPSLFVAHGLGAAAVVHAAQLGQVAGARGAFLVAPPAPDVVAAMPDLEERLRTYPAGPLPFPSVLVASRTHPEGAYDALEDLAFDWGSRFLDAGDAGGIDTASGHGPWPEGLMSFAGFLKSL